MMVIRTRENNMPAKIGRFLCTSASVFGIVSRHSGVLQAFFQDLKKSTIWRSLLCQQVAWINKAESEYEYESNFERICSIMPVYRCSVKGFDSGSRYPESRGNGDSDMQKETFKRFSQKPRKEQWVRNVSKGLEGYQVSNHKTVCSNHFKRQCL